MILLSLSTDLQDKRITRSRPTKEELVLQKMKKDEPWLFAVSERGEIIPENASRILSEAEKDTLHEKGWLGEMATAALHLLCPERVRVQGTTNEEGEILLRENYRGGSHSIWHKLDQDIHMNILNMPNIVPVRQTIITGTIVRGRKLTEEQLEEERAWFLSVATVISKSRAR